ncbi:hypothetical protein CONLIGDRAFT_640256 [Coniochaeta ligniaria NRRL 30616]|uniref:Uncharacterized protein n=1 Tax=Coniochaeta ligniaria NRRL 30616 TaxID=1408157 RepID=A0A1J7J0T7_9PEZI|nr:hypothetical protein CONLIGDRAFT_640256 [Coniochaeta ligniaria NRRL 30616]
MSSCVIPFWSLPIRQPLPRTANATSPSHLFDLHTASTKISSKETSSTRKNTQVPKMDITKMPKPQDLPNPSVPRTAMLLGRDFEKGTYHWEGPLGLPFETLPNTLYGVLKGWTEISTAADRPGPTLLPHMRGDEPTFYLLNPSTEEYRLVQYDDTLFQVVRKADGSQVVKIRRNLLLTVRENPAAPLEIMCVKRSPYALAAFRYGKVPFTRRLSID